MKFVTVFLKWKKIAIGYFSSQFLGGDRENKIFTSRLAKNKLECWFKISLKHSNESLTVNSF